MLTKLKRVRFSIASTGLRRGLSDAATLLLAYDAERDSSFDRQFGTDTTGRLLPTQLGISDTATRDLAILYLPYPARMTRWMLDHVGIDHRQFSFIDLGCGKGRVVLVASEYSFRQIIGVEISPQLSGIARDNILRYRPRQRRCSSVAIHNVDAATFDFPPTPLLVHLYHPFEPELTEIVLARLEKSIQHTPRRVVIAYLLYTAAVEPVEQVFSGSGWLRRIRYEQSVLGQYDWLFYSN